MKVYNTKTNTFVGTAFPGQTPEDVAELTGLPVGDLRLELEPEEVVAAIRSGVVRDIGDVQSQQGKSADLLNLLLGKALVDIIVSGEHPSNEADRLRFSLLQELAGEEDILALAKELMCKIKSRDYLLTPVAKPRGIRGVLEDALDASTKFVRIMLVARGA